MRRIFTLALIVFAVFAFSATVSASQEEELPLLPNDERDPRTFCPYDKSFSRSHLLILVDVTDGISEQQMKMIQNDILTEKLLGSVGLYGKVSVVVLSGTVPVTGLEPIITVCRPKNGNSKSREKRDHFNIMTENRQKINIEYRLGYLRRLRNQTIKIIKAETENREKVQNTPLMETIHEISRSSAIDFGDDYEDRTLVVISNMYHHSNKLPLSKICVKKIFLSGFSSYPHAATWQCPSFQKLKNKRENKFYLEKKIKPKFNGRVNLKLWILHKKQDVGSILDASLLTFWEDYFKYVQGDINFLEPEFEPDPVS